MALNAEQFKQFMESMMQTFQQHLGSVQGAGSNAATLASSLDARIGKFNYDPESGQTFEEWLKRYGNFIEVDGKDLEDSAKVRLLMGKLGDAEYQKFANSILPELPDKLKYNDAISKLKILFCDSRSLFVRQYECLRMKQLPGQDIQSYTAQVNAACENAKLDLSKEMLKCFIAISGLNEQCHDLREKALRLMEDAHKSGTTLTLEKLSEEFRAVQLIRESAQSLSNVKMEFSTNAINSYPQKWKERSGKGQPKGARPQNSVQNSNLGNNSNATKNSNSVKDLNGDSHSVASSNGTPKSPCQSCGQMGHYRQNCKFRQATCYSCGKVGHISRVCQSNSLQRTANVVEINSISINAMQNSENSAGWFQLPVVINGTECVMKMDTASQVALFTSETWAKLEKPKLEKVDIGAINCNGQKFKILGKFECFVSYNGQEQCKLIGYVSEDVVHDLLGIPWIKALKILPAELLNSMRSRPNNSIYSSPKIRTGSGKFDSNSSEGKGQQEFASKNANQFEVSSTKFSRGESVYLLNYRYGKVQWIPGEIVEQIHNSSKYCLWVPSIGHHVRRNAMQIRRRFPFDSEIGQEGNSQADSSPQPNASTFHRSPYPRRQRMPTKFLQIDPAKKFYEERAHI